MSESTVLPNLLPEARSYLFHHVFLPPKLPQKDDYEAEYDLTLVDSVISALNGFKVQAPASYDSAIDPIIEMMIRLRDVQESHGNVSEKILEQELGKLDVYGKSVRLEIILSDSDFVSLRRLSACFCSQSECWCPVDES